MIIFAISPKNVPLTIVYTQSICLIPQKRTRNNRNKKILSYKQTEVFSVMITSMDDREKFWTTGILTDLIKYEQMSLD